MLGFSMGTGRAARIPAMRPYSDEAKLFFDALPSQPPRSIRRHIDGFIRDCKEMGVWTQLERMIVALHVEAAMLRDLRQPDKTATNVNGSTFTPYRGLTGNGVAAHVAFGEAWNSGGRFGNSGGFLFAYTNVDLDGATSGPIGTIGNASNKVTSSTGNGTTANIAGSTSQVDEEYHPRGNHLVLRKDSDTLVYYFNGQKVSEVANTASGGGLSNGVALFRQNASASYYTDRVAAAGFGGPITADQALWFNRRLHDLMLALGANY